MHITSLGLVVLRSHMPAWWGRRTFSRVVQSLLDIGTKVLSHQRQVGLPRGSTVHVLWLDARDVGPHILWVPSIAVLWSRIRDWLYMQQEMSTYWWAMRVFRRHYKGSKILTKARHLALSYVIHYIWRARNSNFFGERELDIERIFKCVQIHVYRSLGVYFDLTLC